MVKKIGVAFILLFFVICLTAPIFAEENAAQGTDTSVQKENMPAKENAPAKEETQVKEEALPAEQGTGEGVITGEITSLDTAAGVITLKAEGGMEKTFSVVNGETILWKGIEDIKLSDVKKGDKAEVGYYTDDAGKLVASWVDLVVPEETGVPGVSSGTPGATTPAPAGTENAPAVKGTSEETTSESSDIE